MLFSSCKVSVHESRGGKGKGQGRGGEGRGGGKSRTIGSGMRSGLRV